VSVVADSQRQIGRTFNHGVSVRYELNEHRHRFSVWAAARATQRGLCDVGTLQKALETCGVVEFLGEADLNGVGALEFDRRHREWCCSILQFLNRQRLADASFGHAAKLLAMYLKPMIILGPASRTSFARVAHPPIDGILLSAIAASPEIECGHKHAWAEIRWTQLNEAAYYRLIGELRSCVAGDEPFWKVERFWTITRTKRRRASRLAVHG
jgi:hypothetical protein